MEDTELRNDDYYKQQTLTGAIAVVIGKRANKMPLMTAKEEMADDFIEEWSELFGYETAK